MVRTKAYILVLLLGIGPLGICLAVFGQERAPWPPPPIMPLPESSDDAPRPLMPRAKDQPEAPPLDTPPAQTSSSARFPLPQPNNVKPMTPAAAPDFPTTAEPPLAIESPGESLPAPQKHTMPAPESPAAPWKAAPPQISADEPKLIMPPVDNAKPKSSPVNDFIPLPAPQPNRPRPQNVTDPMPITLPDSGELRYPFDSVPLDPPAAPPQDAIEIPQSPPPLSPPEKRQPNIFVPLPAPASEPWRQEKTPLKQPEAEPLPPPEKRAPDVPLPAPVSDGWRQDKTPTQPESLLSPENRDDGVPVLRRRLPGSVEAPERPLPLPRVDTKPILKPSAPRFEEETPAFRLLRPLNKPNAGMLTSIPSLNPGPRSASLGPPSLSVEKRGPDVVRLGESITFEILVRNTSTRPADNLRVIDELPYGIRFIKAEPAAAEQQEKVTWEIGRLDPGQQRTIRVTAQATAAGEFTTKAHVQFQTSSELQIRIDPADYVVSIEAPKQVQTGQPVRIDIVVRNASNSRRAGVLLKARLPEIFANPLGPNVETDVDLQPGESRKFTLSATAARSGVAVAEAWLETGDGRFSRTLAEIVVGDQPAWPQATPEQQRTAHTQRPPDKTLAGRMTVRAIGARIARERPGELRVEIANFTSSDVRNLAITATIPATLDFLDASDKGLYHRASKTIYWFVDNVAAGQVRSLTVQVKGKNSGKAEFRVQAGMEGGKQAQTQAAVVVEEQTSQRVRDTGQMFVSYEPWKGTRDVLLAAKMGLSQR